MGAPDPRTVDFKRIIERTRHLLLEPDPDLTIVAARDACLEATMTRREAIVGRPLFGVFPDNPDDPGATGVSNLRASLERVVRDGVPDALALQKHDIRRPDEDGGGFDVRHWSPINVPIHGEGGCSGWSARTSASARSWTGRAPRCSPTRARSSRSSPTWSSTRATRCPAGAT